jgi:uncharacterized SAM-binding protein YcdF (DUF218 family)
VIGNATNDPAREDAAGEGAGAGRAARLARRLAAPAAGILVAAGLWLAGFVWFAQTLPRAVTDRDQATDAVVVLTGGRLRVEEGLELLRHAKATWLLVSGVHQGVTVGEILHLVPDMPAELQCCIALGYAAADTAGNAQETASWVRERGFRSLRLVTAAYHMPRALVELRRALPDVAIVPNPVFPERVRPDWWAWPGSAWLLAGEYNKYVGAVLRSLVQAAGGPA